MIDSNGKPIIRTGRGRGNGRASRPSQQAKESTRESVLVRVHDDRIFNSNVACEESKADHIVPRRSTTAAQYLGFLPQQIETEPMRWRQLDKVKHAATGEITMIEGTDERLTFRSPRTLLTTRDPFAYRNNLKRSTSHSKRIVPDPDLPLPVEQDQELDLDLGD